MRWTLTDTLVVVGAFAAAVGQIVLILIYLIGA